MAHCLLVRATGQAQLRYGYGLRRATSWANWSGLATLGAQVSNTLSFSLNRLVLLNREGQSRMAET
jgi:hypothetical protein